MKQKCSRCGANSMSDLCWKCKPSTLKKSNLRPKLAPKRHLLPKEEQSINPMWEFFLQIWKKRIHLCTNCGGRLGNRPFSYFFDHTLEKSKYPELKFEEDNIMLLCLSCHDKKTRGFYSEIIKEKIKLLKEEFNVY